jgi:two-component system sensor histidine kinase CssS
MEPNVYFHGEEEPWRITVENLIDNALRYAKTTIRIRLRENELCVINDGKAISEDRIDKLFRPYEKGSDGQFGLGLSIVYKVCTTYGYHVTAENLQEGVSFRIWKEGGRKRRRNSRGKKKKEKANNA